MKRHVAASFAFFAALLLLMLASRSRTGLYGLIVYELFTGAGICALVFALAVSDGSAPWGLPLKVFFWLAIAPALAQMAFAARLPQMSWLAPVCFLALWRVVKKCGVPPSSGEEKLRLKLPANYYWWTFLLLLPLCLWDWRQFPALYGLWFLALKALQSV
ncbi:MAG: hypothetical protein PHP45_03210 [Elusimicrobiales bacterium]|nr:hypothetical protein [Elusimicrobiales bacterium]